jgi:NTP pyrophosphatase (non-canonical NTP hydrolase)
MPKIDTTKLAVLHQKIIDFNAVRGWDPSAQNIAKSIVIEAAELLEHFQWDSQDYGPSDKDTVEIGNEMADVIWYLILLSEKLNIDLVSAIEHKYDHNGKKYPADQFQGKHNKEFYFAQKKKYRQDKS